jgi:hypothetical protein
MKTRLNIYCYGCENEYSISFKKEDDADIPELCPFCGDAIHMDNHEEEEDDDGEED